MAGAFVKAGCVHLPSILSLPSAFAYKADVLLDFLFWQPQPSPDPTSPLTVAGGDVSNEMTLSTDISK